MARTEVSAAHALKAFKKLPLVQTAKAVKIPVLDQDEKPTGEMRDVYETRKVEARAEHVRAAAQYDDRMVIVTIDGKRHEVEGSFEAEGAPKKDEKK